MPEETAKALLAKLLRRQRELRFELETLQRTIDGYRQLQEMRDENPDAAQLPLWPGGSRKALQSEQVAELLDAARRIILAERRPMRRGELVKLLEAQGYVIEGADKARVFGTNIWRSGKFRNVLGMGYWPNDVDPPPGLKLL